MHRSHPIILCAIMTVAAASQALAVRPAVWLHEQPRTSTKANSTTRSFHPLGKSLSDARPRSFTNCKDGGKNHQHHRQSGDGQGVPSARGPRASSTALTGNKVVEFAALPEGGSILSMLFTKDGRLLAGTGGGPQAKIYLIEGSGKARVFHEPPKATYIWAMARGTDGEVYAATGNKGQLFKIEPDGSKSASPQRLKPKNLLCLAFGRDGFLYTGTDEDGLIYRVDPADGKAFVLYRRQGARNQRDRV